MFKKFKVRDVIFLAVLAAVTTLFGGVGMPVMRSEIFGLQTLVTSPFYALFAVIAIRKINKPGTLSLFGLFTGFPLFLWLLSCSSITLLAASLQKLRYCLFSEAARKKLPQ